MGAQGNGKPQATPSLPSLSMGWYLSICSLVGSRRLQEEYRRGVESKASTGYGRTHVNNDPVCAQCCRLINQDECFGNMPYIQTSLQWQIMNPPPPLPNRDGRPFTGCDLWQVRHAQFHSEIVRASRGPDAATTPSGKPWELYGCTDRRRLRYSVPMTMFPWQIGEYRACLPLGTGARPLGPRVLIPREGDKCFHRERCIGTGRGWLLMRLLDRIPGACIGPVGEPGRVHSFPHRL